MNLFEPRVAQSAVRSEAESLDDVYNPVIKRSVIKWAAYEVERQHDHPKHVLFMLDAWRYALRESRRDYEYEGSQRWPSLLNILTLGYIVKPDINVQGVRKYNVSVGFSQKLDWQQVPRSLENLATPNAYKALEAKDWYREFEEIHPFGDGNGRVGSILYNWLKDTLDDPKYPPDVYDPHFWYKIEEDTFRS
jgi:hypothetical protein